MKVHDMNDFEFLLSIFRTEFPDVIFEPIITLDFEVNYESVSLRKFRLCSHTIHEDHLLWIKECVCAFKQVLNAVYEKHNLREKILFYTGNEAPLYDDINESASIYISVRLLTKDERF